MSEKDKQEKYTATKKPISKKTIFRMMVSITYAVSGVFFLKNIIGGNIQGMLAIGVCILIYSGVLGGMRAMKADVRKQQYVACISMLFLVFVISLNSGACYSDDFGLYMAILALSGMYLRPKYTATQIVLADVMLVLQYLIHPEKAESLSQYIMCLGIFTLGGCILYVVIKRGRCFIDYSENRAQEAERLLESLQQVGVELERNVIRSTLGIESMKEANDRLNHNAEELRQGSESIAQGAREVADTYEDVQRKMDETEKQVVALTEEVQGFENSLSMNRKNMEVMSREMESVQITMNRANEVFQLLEQHMGEICEVTEQLNAISASTTMLALNASIEAARAGKSGAGFAVVASKVQELAVDSTKCSAQVVGVVDQMQRQIQETMRQLTDSGVAIDASLDALKGLQGGFDNLNDQFDSLYQNIEAQNSNIGQVNSIFEHLKNDIMEMSQFSEDNKGTVEDIAEAMKVYKENMDGMIEDTKDVHKLTTNMLQFAQ